MSRNSNFVNLYPFEGTDTTRGLSTVTTPQHTERFSYRHSASHYATSTPQLKNSHRLSIEEIRHELEKLSIDSKPLLSANPPKCEEFHCLLTRIVEDVLGLDKAMVRIEEKEGCSIPGFSQPNLFGGNTNRNVEDESNLYVSAIGNLRFFRLCEYVCRDIFSIPTIKIDHFFNPNRAIIIQILQAYIHFLRFHDEIHTEFKEGLDSMQQLAEQIKVVDTHVQNIQIDYEKLVNRHSQLESETKETSKEIENLTNECKLLKGQLQRYCDTNQNLQLQIKQEKNEITDLEYQISKTSNEIKTLQSQLTDSPEQLEKEQIAKEEHLSKMKRKYEMTYQKFKENETQSDQLQILSSQINCVMTNIEQHLNDILQPLINLHGHIFQVKEDLLFFEEEQKKNRTIKQKLEEDQTNEMENLNELKKSWDQKISNLESQFKQSASTLQLTMQEAKTQSDQVREVTHELHTVEQEQLTLQLNHNEVFQEIKKFHNIILSTSASHLNQIKKLRNQLLLPLHNYRLNSIDS